MNAPFRAITPAPTPARADELRALDIVAQIDRPSFALAFGVQPDRRDYAVRTRQLVNSRMTFIRFWAFVVIFVKWVRS